MKRVKTNKNLLKLFLINIAIILLVFLGFFLMRGGQQIVYVDTIAANLRAQPSPFSPVITQTHQEDKVTIIDEKDHWYKIQTADKVEGWVAQWLLFDGTSGPYTNLPAIISNRKVELKQTNDAKSKTLRKLKRKQKVTVTLELNGWVRIYTGEEYGWVKSEDVSIRKGKRPSIKEQDHLYVAVSEANLLKTKEPTSDTLTSLPYATKLNVISEQDNGWVEVSTNDGSVGFLAPFEVTTRELSKDEKKPAIPMSEFSVMLDPGHGGNDTGAQTNDGTVVEKDLTLATAKVVKKELESHGFNVLMTREKDEIVPLLNIAKKSSESQADAFISMHYDSTGEPNEGSGTTTFYNQSNSKELAQAINDSLASILPLSNRGFAKQDYLVLKENKKPSVLLELGYINNDTDASYAQSEKYHQKVADAIYDGLMYYIHEKSPKDADN